MWNDVSHVHIKKEKKEKIKFLKIIINNQKNNEEILYPFCCCGYDGHDRM